MASAPGIVPRDSSASTAWNRATMAAARAFVAASALSANSAVTAAASANSPGSSPSDTGRMNACHFMTPASIPAPPDACAKRIPAASTACRPCAAPTARATLGTPPPRLSIGVNVPVQTMSITGVSGAVTGPIRVTFALTPSAQAAIVPAWVTLIVPPALPTSRRSASTACSCVERSVTPLAISIATPPAS